MLDKDMNRENKQRMVFILGMHRSGTSCLAGSLERCGLYLGAVSRRAESNPKNFLYELEEVNDLHDQILTENGGTWYLPPSHIYVRPNQKQALKRIISQLTKYVPCGLKDPRLLLLLDIWLETAGSFTLVGTFRHPVAVGQSLVTRYKMGSVDMIYPLWLRYNSELVRLHRMYQFPIVEFDLSDVETYCRTIAALAIELGLGPDLARLREFVSSDLYHNPSSEEPVPEICQEIYTYLRQHRYQPAIWGNDFERQVLAAQQRFAGWQWSPDKFESVLHPAVRFAPRSLIQLGRRWLSRLNATR